MKSFGGRYLDNWLRWGLWILFLGVGFHGGELVALILHNDLATGLFMFVTGVIGYLVGGAILGALVAVIPTSFPGLRIFPTTIPMGMLRVFVIGFALGTWVIYSNPSRYVSQTVKQAAPNPAIPSGNGNLSTPITSAKLWRRNEA